MPTPLIRNAVKADLEAIVAILNPYILETAITFDTEPYTMESRLPWWHQFANKGRHQCLVAVQDGSIKGYACSAPLRPKKAYDTSVEVSIYQPLDKAIRGLGSLLYKDLFERLATEDVHRAHALVTLPNDKSYQFHKKFGFNEIGVLNEAGRKFDRYHDVCWMEKKLR